MLDPPGKKENRMHRKMSIAVLLIGIVTWAGCGPSTVPLKVALKAVGQDLLDTKVTNISDLMGADAEATEAVKDQIKQFQCFYRKANPLIPIFAKDFTLSLQGTITLGGNASVGAAGPAPSGSIGFNVSDAKTQGLTVPITWTPLASLPKIYLQQQMSYLQGSFGLEKARYGETKSFKDNYADLIEDEYVQITREIMALINGWSAHKKHCNPQGGQDYPGGMKQDMMIM
jgi:hypothetical protein